MVHHARAGSDHWCRLLKLDNEPGATRRVLLRDVAVSRALALALEWC